MRKLLLASMQARLSSMLRTFMLVSIFSVLSFGIISCTLEGVQNEIIPEVTIPNGYTNYFIDDLSLDYDASETKVAFQINTDWNMQFVSENGTFAEWCVITPSSGNAGLHKVMVSVAQNDTYEPRAGKICLIANSNKIAEIAVKQSCENAIKLNTKSDTVSYEGANINIVVEANVDFDCRITDNCSSWVHEVVSSRSMSSHNFEFAIDENLSFYSRKAQIVFYNSRYDLRETFIIIQEGNPNGIVDGTPVLWSSSNSIIADGNNEASFSVMVDSIDVTKDATFYLNEQPYNCNTFSTTTAGTYNFHAIYNNQRTNIISIRAIDTQPYADLPYDERAEQFDCFERKVLVTWATGTWEGYSPYMIRALELFEENGSNASKAVIVATHSGDEFSCEASEAAVSASKVSGFPSCVLNLNPEAIIDNAQPEVNAERINTAVGMELKEVASVGLAATAIGNQDNSVIYVHAGVKIGADGNYRVNAWLIEDGVAASQSSYWSEFSNGKSSIVIDHMHILRGANCTQPIYGQCLGDKETCKYGEIVDFFGEISVTDANISNISNCKIVVIVSKKLDNSSRFTVNNVIELKIGESVPFIYI